MKSGSRYLCVIGVLIITVATLCGADGVRGHRDPVNDGNDKIVIVNDAQWKVRDTMPPPPVEDEMISKYQVDGLRLEPTPVLWPKNDEWYHLHYGSSGNERCYCKWNDWFRHNHAHVQVGDLKTAVWASCVFCDIDFPVFNIGSDHDDLPLATWTLMETSGDNPLSHILTCPECSSSLPHESRLRGQIHPNASGTIAQMYDHDPDPVTPGYEIHESISTASCALSGGDGANAYNDTEFIIYATYAWGEGVVQGDLEDHWDLAWAVWNTSEASWEIHVGDTVKTYSAESNFDACEGGLRFNIGVLSNNPAYRHYHGDINKYVWHLKLFMAEDDDWDSVALSNDLLVIDADD